MIDISDGKREKRVNKERELLTLGTVEAPYYAIISEQKRGVFLSQGPLYLPGVDSPLNCGDQVARNYASLAYYC